MKIDAVHVQPLDFIQEIQLGDSGHLTPAKRPSLRNHERRKKENGKRKKKGELPPGNNVRNTRVGREHLREFFVYISDSVFQLGVLIRHESEFRHVSGSVPSGVEISQFSCNTHNATKRRVNKT